MAKLSNFLLPLGLSQRDGREVQVFDAPPKRSNPSHRESAVCAYGGIVRVADNGVDCRERRL